MRLNIRSRSSPFNDFMTWYGIPYHFANVSKQLIRLRNVLHAEAVVIKVIIDNSRVGLEGLVM